MYGTYNTHTTWSFHQLKLVCRTPKLQVFHFSDIKLSIVHAVGIHTYLGINFYHYYIIFYFTISFLMEILFNV
jgi:hypothetical protein